MPHVDIEQNPMWLRYAMRSLLEELSELRPIIAQSAQLVYDEWKQSEDGEDEVFGYGGICDEVTNAIANIVATAVPDVDFEEGGWDGDDHAYIIVSRGGERCVVDIPHGIYESGGGYSWKKVPDVIFQPGDVVVDRIE